MASPVEKAMQRSTSSQSFSDSSSTAGDVDSNTAPYYTANITAACQAANAPRPHDLSTEEEVQLAKRRKSNRLSARRWRNRKKRNFTELRNQILELSKEQSELILEKSKLEQELRAELQMAMSYSAHMPPAALVPSRRSYVPRPTVSDHNTILLRALLASQGQGQGHHPQAAQVLMNPQQGLGNITLADPLFFNAFGSTQRNMPFSIGNPTAPPQTSSFLSSNEACAVSALLRGFMSEA